MRFRKESASWAGLKVHPKAGKFPPFFMANGIEIFIDESGDFGPFDEWCPYYIVTMVFHESEHPLFSRIRELEYRLSFLNLEGHCVHSSPAIRGEGEYHGMDLAIRRKLMSYFAAFVRRSDLKYKCFFVRKKVGCDETETVDELRSIVEPFITDNAERLSAYSTITVAYDKGQRPLSQLITEIFARRFQQVRMVRTLPIFSRLFQAADFVCTLRRLAFKIQENGTLSRSEHVFFGSEGTFLKNWLKPLLKSEWK